MSRRGPDFTVSDVGSLGLVRPTNTRARKYLVEHVPEDAQWFGSSLVVEPRYVRDLVAGLINDGWEVA